MPYTYILNGFPESLIPARQKKTLSSPEKILKFVQFPANQFHYSEKELKFLNATSIWIGRLILQIVTTLTSAYSTFNVLIDRLFIRTIKVISAINALPMRILR